MDQFSQAWQFHALFKGGSLIPFVIKIQYRNDKILEMLVHTHACEIERLQAISAIDADATANGIQCAVTVR